MKGDNIMKYRSEILFGDDFRDVAKIMAHETFELGNSDIMNTLRETILKDSPLAKKLDILVYELDFGYISKDDINGEMYNLIQTHDSYDDNDNSPSILFIKDVLNEIKNITGKDVKYALWLCDEREHVYDYDIHHELTDDDIDVYEETDIVLSDIGIGGKLYGYETEPKSMCTLSELESGGSGNIRLRSEHSSIESIYKNVYKPLILLHEPIFNFNKEG